MEDEITFLALSGLISLTFLYSGLSAIFEFKRESRTVAKGPRHARGKQTNKQKTLLCFVGGSLAGFIWQVWCIVWLSSRVSSDFLMPADQRSVAGITAVFFVLTFLFVYTGVLLRILIWYELLTMKRMRVSGIRGMERTFPFFLLTMFIIVGLILAGLITFFVGQSLVSIIILTIAFVPALVGLVIGTYFTSSRFLETMLTDDVGDYSPARKATKTFEARLMELGRTVVQWALGLGIGFCAAAGMLAYLALHNWKMEPVTRAIFLFLGILPATLLLVGVMIRMTDRWKESADEEEAIERAAEESDRKKREQQVQQWQQLRLSEPKKSPEQLKLSSIEMVPISMEMGDLKEREGPKEEKVHSVEKYPADMQSLSAPSPVLIEEKLSDNPQTPIRQSLDEEGTFPIPIQPRLPSPRRDGRITTPTLTPSQSEWSKDRLEGSRQMSEADEDPIDLQQSENKVVWEIVNPLSEDQGDQNESRGFHQGYSPIVQFSKPRAESIESISIERPQIPGFLAIHRTSSNESRSGLDEFNGRLLFGKIERTSSAQSQENDHREK